jgi:hypothetical protein
MLVRDRICYLEIRFVITLILDISSLKYKLPHLYTDGIVSLLIKQYKSYFTTVSLSFWCGRHSQ